MSTLVEDPRRRNYKILRLFFGLVLSFSLQYIRMRVTGRSYNFFSDSRRNRQRAIRIRTVSLEMGGVLIKVGQFLSSRVDLLPPEYIEELALLQDEVPPVPYEAIRQKVERELGAPIETIFKSFDPEPIAAASLGQVHRAVLPTGEVVAVKVQRPGIDRIVETDLKSLRYIVGWLDRHSSLRKRTNLPVVFREFEETLTQELDYQREGHNAERGTVNFREVRDVVIPRVYWSHSKGDVLTLQFMAGTKINDFAALERQGISRSLVAETLMRIYLQQVLVDGFFHADPHPGNVLVRPGPVIVLLDYGMVGEITPEMRENIRQVFVGVIRRDFDSVINALSRLGFVAPGADRRVLKRALIWTVDNFYNLSFGELQAVDPVMVLNELQDVIFSESLQIPANYGFLGRALGTLSGISTALDPSFQFTTVWEPFGQQLMQGDHGLMGTLRQVGSEVRSLALTTYRLPYQAGRALNGFEDGTFDIRSEADRVVDAAEHIDRSVRKVLYGVLVVGFLVAGTIVFTNQPIVALVALLVALLLLATALFPSRRR